MDTIIFLPGGGGSCLELQGNEIWPPTLLEFMTHYGRMQQLIDPRVQPSGIVNTIPPNQLLGVPVYSPILSDLYAIQDILNVQNNLSIPFVPFPYDFRKSVFDSANALQAQIEECYNNGSRSIALVCHSTGNQVARAVLENPQLQGQDWFQSLNTYVGICGPHFGVPEVLEYGLGLSDWLSIRATDMQTFSRDHRYPGCYQLLPFQTYDVQYDVLNDVQSGAEDFYQAAIATEFALDQTNLDAAIDLQQLLNFQNKPNGVNYALVAAYGHATDQTINYDGQTFVNILSNAPGDGTVPLWSAAPGPFTALITPGDHFSVMSTHAFRDFLWMLLTGEHAPFLQLDVAGVTISLDQLVYSVGEPISMLFIPDKAAEQIVGTLKVEKAVGHKGRKFKRFKSQPFAYRGPPVRFVSAEMTAPAEPGIYRITLSGKTHATAPQIAAQFAVSETTGRRTQRRDRRRGTQHHPK